MFCVDSNCLHCFILTYYCFLISFYNNLWSTLFILYSSGYIFLNTNVFYHNIVILKSVYSLVYFDKTIHAQENFYCVQVVFWYVQNYKYSYVSKLEKQY